MSGGVLRIDRMTATLRQDADPGTASGPATGTTAAERAAALHQRIAQVELERAWREAGLPAGHWCLRRVNVRLAMAGPVSDTELAGRWARGVADAIRSAVAGRDPEVVHYRTLLDALADAVAAAGADAIIVHARKAWLKGLSPKENREVPPLDYGRVRRLKRRYPALPIMLNGGLATLGQALAELGEVDGVTLDGVMLGRAAYQEPNLLISVDPLLFGEAAPVADAFEAVAAYEPYIAARLAEGSRLHAMTRHMLGLFNGRPGARAWRRHLATEGVKPGAGLETLRDALALVGRDGVRAEEAA